MANRPSSTCLLFLTLLVEEVPHWTLEMLERNGSHQIAPAHRRNASTVRTML